MSERSYLVAGLGNIGSEYALTRHNMGFMVLDAWSQASGIVFNTARYGDIATITVKGRKFHLLKPSTYMNLSGNAVRYWMNELDIPISNIIVICDDLNLPFGNLRMRGSGSDGGHNGLRNIINLIGTESFARVRMGIGHDFHEGGQVDYVIGKMSGEELSAMPVLCKKVIDGVQEWAFAGIQKAMTDLNSKINR